MKAVFMEGLNKLVLKEVPKPIVNDEEVLIKVDSCSICGSDVRILKTGNKRIKYPAVLGHEIAGTVAESKNNKFKVGDKVCLAADLPCGHCEWCKKGLANDCIDSRAFGYEYQGGFAEFLKLDKRIVDFGPVVILPKNDISQDEFALSEPLACCINGLERCEMGKDKSILIFGAGPIGILFAKLARMMQASKIVMCDIDPDRVKMAKIDGVRNVLVSELNKEKFDIVITACSSLKAQEQAFDYVRKRGIINLFSGLPENSEKLCINSNQIHYEEITVLGSHGSTPRHHKMAAEMIAKNKIDVKDLISKKFPLDKFSEAFDLAKSKDSLKIIINP